MKRFLTLLLMVFAMLYALFGCGSGGKVIDYGLVFVNDSDDEAPPEGERWYVTARDGESGLVLSVDTCWQAEV